MLFKIFWYGGKWYSQIPDSVAVHCLSRSSPMRLEDKLVQPKVPKFDHTNRLGRRLFYLKVADEFEGGVLGHVGVLGMEVGT